MSSTAQDLRTHLARVGRAKSDARRVDAAEHLAASLAERLEATIRLSQQWIDTGMGARTPDGEPETWRRVLAHLRDSGR